MTLPGFADAEQAGVVLASRYKLLEAIGEGGMGTVWLAQQTEPVKRLVALKVIKPGMDSGQVIARFEAERQALALMDHPNIARVFDAGATGGGRPYFVMELVKGVPLTKYCDEHRLSPKERLELFIPVCQAIQHAHQKGIIHRDIKPSNVLVALYDGKPVPKVIDFGVAKATGQKLTEHTLVTGFGAVVGTLEYMSPEQAEFNQLDIDTRSDIYSLGVLLYELLTGTTPLDRKRLKQAALLELLRMIREDELPRPSMRLSDAKDALPSISAQRHTEPAKLTKLVRGELDWIVMKALEKERNRRYETANGFAQDIQRYLADEPVQACPPSAWYRLRKFVRRKKTTLAVAACVVLALAGVAGGIGWAVRDHAAREEVIERQRLAREEQIERQRLAREDALDQTVERTLEETGPLIEEGKWPEALAAVERADKLLAAAGRTERPPRLLELRKALSMAEHLEEINRPPIRDLKANVIGSSGKETKETNQNQLNPFEEVLRQERLADAAFARAFRELGIDIDALAPAAAAGRIGHHSIRAALVKALDEWAPLRRGGSTLGVSNPGWTKLIEIARLADPDPWRNRCREAVLRRDRQALEQLADAIPIHQVSPKTLWLLGLTLREVGALDKAMGLLLRAQHQYPTDLWINEILGNFSGSTRPPRMDDALRFYSIALALRPQRLKLHVEVSHLLLKKGAGEEALAECSKMIELNPKVGCFWRGYIYGHLQQYDKALADFSKAIELDPKDAQALGSRGGIHICLKQYDKAIADYTKAIDLDPKDAALWRWRGWTYIWLKQYDKGLADYTKAIEVNPQFAPYWIERAGTYYQLQQYDKALADYTKVIALDPKNASGWHNRGNAYHGLQQYDKALADYTKAIELDPKIASYWWSRHNVYYDLKQYDKAIADDTKGHELQITFYTKAIELDPKSVWAWHCRAREYRDLKQYDKAVADYTRAIELDPKSKRVWSDRAYVYNELKQYDKAVADYTKLIELDPKNAGIWSNRARAYSDLQQYDKALADYAKAIELDPKNAWAWFQRGRTYHYQLQQYDKAVADYTKAIELDPKNAGIWNIRGNACNLLKQYDKALADCTRAIELDPKYTLHLEHPGQRLLRAQAVRQGRRRLHQGHRAGPEGRGGLEQPGQCVRKFGPIGQGKR